MKNFLRMAALVLVVAATIATGESQAKPVRPSLCQGSGCTTLAQCDAVCGRSAAVCVNHRCVQV